jgi:aldehyde dehydrogenase
MSTTPAINETLIRDIVEEVVNRLGRPTAPGAAASSAPAATAASASAPAKAARGGRHFGVFTDVNEACEAAAAAQEQLTEQGVAARIRALQIVKALADANAAEWGRIELEETKIGRLDHKIQKLKILKLVPGVEFLRPDAWSGDNGITHEEYCPFGVIGAVTPSTHSIPTLTGNLINMVAAGNTAVFNAHPGATRCAAMAVRAYNEAIHRELGIEYLAAIIEQPTLDSFKALCANPHVRLLCITGGPGVVRAAMQAGKRAICGGPGNPPVVVDAGVDCDRAARDIIAGAAYDNNLLCIGEKEVFVLDAVADALMAALERNGAARLNDAQIERLTKQAFVFPEGQGAGCPEPVVNKSLIGRDAVALAKEAGAVVPAQTQLLFGETDTSHLFVVEEQMMPFLPVVRVRDITEAIVAARNAEHHYRHTAIIHTHNVHHMTAMGRALNTSLFVKNGSCMAGLGLGGEGYLSYTVATPTGEGVTNPKTFCRVRRCTMVDNLKIY